MSRPRFDWRGKSRALAAAAGFLTLLSTSPAAAEKRIALVIGNSTYQNVTPLDNPSKDAVLMADTLDSLGFTLIGGRAQLNLDKTAMDNAVQNFGRQVQGADVALFYYAGHGVQVSGSNYLVPINANPTREADVDFQMVDINLVLRQMQGSGTRLNLVILDACRNNPFGARSLRSSDGGLAQMRAPEGTLISYATQPGSVAQDGSDGHHWRRSQRNCQPERGRELRPGMFPAAAAPERSSDLTDASGAGPRRNNSATFCSW